MKTLVFLSCQQCQIIAGIDRTTANCSKKETEDASRSERQSGELRELMGGLNFRRRRGQASREKLQLKKC